MRRAARGIAPPGEHGRLGLRQRALALGAQLGQVEVELGPLRARDRPLVLVAEMVCAVTGADRELHRRVPPHAPVRVPEPRGGGTKMWSPPRFACDGSIKRAPLR